MSKDYDRVKLKDLGNGVKVMDRSKPFDGKYEQCSKDDDLRPYGAAGEWICFDCGMKDKAMTNKRMGQVLFGEKPDA
jgi:hypothetical protein